jgi:hypothetical protein
MQYSAAIAIANIYIEVSAHSYSYSSKHHQSNPIALLHTSGAEVW